MSVDDAGNFLSRWSRRKAQARTGAPSATPQNISPSAASAAAGSASATLGAVTSVAAGPASDGRATPTGDSQPALAEGAGAVPMPTLDDVAALTAESDFSSFVKRGVDPGVRNAAMKKLFSDPHYNVMDGLDTYIDDYNKTTPIPPSVLRMMVQSEFLGLFDHEKEGASDARTSPESPSEPVAAPEPAADHQVCDDDADLQLQPDDAAGRPGPHQGPGPAEV